jgi:hypothetical protein
VRPKGAREEVNRAKRVKCMVIEVDRIEVKGRNLYTEI